jgi:hypothetical protein
MDLPALLPRGQFLATINSLAVESIGRVTTGPGSNAWPTSAKRSRAAWSRSGINLK